MGRGQMSRNEALNCLPQDFVSDTEEEGSSRKRCHECFRGAVPQSEGGGLEEKLVGIKTGKAQRLSGSWMSSDPGGAM